ncbi:MAG: hypothetical protein ACPG3X_08140, partial [Opitutales bacterium]
TASTTSFGTTSSIRYPFYPPGGSTTQTACGPPTKRSAPLRPCASNRIIVALTVRLRSLTTVGSGLPYSALLGHDGAF